MTSFYSLGYRVYWIEQTPTRDGTGVWFTAVMISPEEQTVIHTPDKNPLSESDIKEIASLLAEYRRPPFKHTEKRKDSTTAALKDVAFKDVLVFKARDEKGKLKRLHEGVFTKEELEKILNV